MASISQLDIEIEIRELCQEIQNEILLQLEYYNASVYKSETAEVIKDKINKLKMVVEIMSDDRFLEPFEDYNAEVANGVYDFNSNESMFVGRVKRLIISLSKQFEVHFKNRKTEKKEIQIRVKKRKKDLLSLCTYGSRPWCFFQMI